MKLLLRFAVVLLLLAVAVFAIGWFLPAGHVASRSASFARSPQDIYAVVSDVATYPRWWPELSQVEMLPTTTGRVRFRQHTSNGPLVMEVVERVPPSRFVTRIDDPDQPFGGTWTFELTPEAGGTRLTITERGEVYNPLFRFLSRFVFGHTGTIDSFLTALSQAR
jgi:ribosome-associated toxin RatA of RatAB toxin-antitoxin module